jgi:hypothetical protein
MMSTQNKKKKYMVNHPSQPVKSGKINKAAAQAKPSQLPFTPSKQQQPVFGTSSGRANAEQSMSSSSSGDQYREEQQEQTFSGMMRGIMNKNGRVEQNNYTLKYNNPAMELLFLIEHHM